MTAIPVLTKGRSDGWHGRLVPGHRQRHGRLAADFESASDDSNHGLIGTTTLANGTWYHAAATYDGTTFRLYLDGVQRGLGRGRQRARARGAPTTPPWPRP